MKYVWHEMLLMSLTEQPEAETMVTGFISVYTARIVLIMQPCVFCFKMNTILRTTGMVVTIIHRECCVCHEVCVFGSALQCFYEPGAHEITYF